MRQKEQNFNNEVEYFKAENTEIRSDYTGGGLLLEASFTLVTH